MNERKPGGYTMKEVCEHIVKADILTKKLTADEIYNLSPTGELYHVFEWFKIACDKIGNPEI